MQPFVDELLAMFPEGVSLSEPYFCGNEKKYLAECIDTGWVSTGGPFVSGFEEKLSEYTGAHASVVANGTAGLHLCYHMMGIEYGDEVLLPSLTFVATANALKYLGAIPHFVDSEEEQLGVDPSKLRTYLSKIVKVENGRTLNKNTGRPIKALVVMHTFGLIGFIDEIKEVCDEYCLELIEDAAESLGSFYRGRHSGTFGRIAALSFNGNKVMTTGGGGALVTTDKALAQKAKHLINQAKVAHAWDFIHDEVGFNYRMPNINAALGMAQLETLNGFLESKRRLHQIYSDRLSGIKGIRLVHERPDTQSNYWLNAVIIDDPWKSERNEILQGCIDQKVQMRPIWRLMHRLDMYKDCPRMNLDCAENLEQRVLNLPSSVFLADRLS